MWRKLIITGICLVQSFTFALAHQRIDTATSVAQHERSAGLTALVIGNSNYSAAPLPASLNDAQAMSRLLRRMGFDVIVLNDGSGAQMAAALQEFERRLQHGGTGLFYFAGHGYRQTGRTMLAPVNRTRGSDAANQDIDLRTVIDRMSAPRAGMLNLIVLDACLDDIDARVTGPASSLPLPANTLIVHAAAPGAAAMEGERHGIFTAELLRAMSASASDIETMFATVAATVARTSDRKQRPWILSTLVHAGALPAPADKAKIGELLLADAGAPLRTRGVLPKDGAEQYELSFWESIKDSTHASDYEAYLEAYPKGRFAALAKARIQRLKAAAKEDAGDAAQPPAKAAAPAPTPAAPKSAAPKPAVPKVAVPKAAEPASQPQADTPAPPARTTAGASPSKDEFRDCPTCPLMVSLKKGAFSMGSNSSDPSEKPAHAVTINAAYAIGKYEVTVEEWNACATAGDCPRIATDAARPKAPVRDVSWDDVQAYAKWLTKTTGKPYRLPTEAEWEYAARAGTSTRYWWGNQMRQGNGNCKDCGQPWQQDMPAPVGSFAANPYGLHDMNGSVWEWVSDCWHSSYKGAPSTGKSWDEPNCRVRVIRGGSWREGADYMPTTTRFKYDSTVRQSQNGFRVAREMD